MPARQRDPQLTVPRPPELNRLSPPEAARAVDRFIGAPQWSGSWVIEPVSIDNVKAAVSALKGAQQIGGRGVPEGEYICLRRIQAGPRRGDADGQTQTVMSNTPDEIADHEVAFAHATGRVLITGLGLSMVVSGLLAKTDVEHIDVVERDADIIRMVAPAYAEEDRVTIHHADAMTWTPPPRVLWDFAWHDIWARIDVRNLTSESAENNIGYGDLLRRFEPYTARQEAWALPLALAMHPDGIVAAEYRERWEDAQRFVQQPQASPPATSKTHPEVAAGDLLEARVRTPQHVVQREFPAETIVLNLDTGQYHGLNPVAGRMLQAVVRAERAGDAVPELAAEYGQPADRIATELESLVADLLERGLVEVDGSA